MTLRAALHLFEAALALPPAQREAHIRAQSADDAAVCAAALGLLAAHAGSAGFLEPEQLPPARELGAYRLLRELGSGGMGRVWLAERRDGAYQQQVAIKVFASLLGDAEALRRAEAERQFLAWLDHPHIARVLDGGTTPQGQPYVVMEYVEGIAIDAWCRAQKLDLRARVLLFLDVLEAVDAAHRALIIHRDVKPANVLVTADGRVKLLDFGIAKSLDGRADALTRTGLLPLTPEYASPEQLAAAPLTTACDIYALGLLLFELLSGSRAHAGIGVTDLARVLAEQAPPRPSAHLDAEALGLAAARARRDWQRRLTGDLDRVVLKALQPEPVQRYASVQLFADDLRRWLAQRPVLARPASLGYRLGKFLQRRRWAAAAAALAVLALSVSLALALAQTRRAAAEGERALRANRFLLGMISRADPNYGGKPPLLVDALDRAVADIPQQLAGQPLLEADIRRAMARAYLTLQREDAAQAQIERAAALYAGQRGTGYAEVLGTQAVLEWQLGRYATAETLFRQALQQCEDDLRGQRQRSELLNDFAALLNDLGRYAEALPLAEQSWTLKQGLQQEIAPRDFGVTLSNQANALDGLGRFAESEAMYRRALAAFEALQPPPELDIAIALNNYAYLLGEMGQYDQAVRQQERAVALYRRVMGPDYPPLVTQLSNLAQQYARLGRHDEARAAMEEALRLLPQAFAAGDQKAANLHTGAARVALARGDRAEARRQAQQALAIYAAAESVEPGRREKAQAVFAEAESGE